MSAARIDLTWGPIDYHRTSLDNLQVGARSDHSGSDHIRSGHIRPDQTAADKQLGGLQASPVAALWPVVQQQHSGC